MDPAQKSDGWKTYSMFLFLFSLGALVSPYSVTSRLEVFSTGAIIA
jgi:hypothetical protein